MRKIQFALLLAGSLFLSSVSAQQLRIYTSQEPPLNFSEVYDEDAIYNNSVTGLATDVVREIIKRTKTDAKIELVPWARGYTNAQKQENAVIYSIARLEQRENLFHWVGPIAKQNAILYSKKGAKIKINNLDDLKKAGTIGTLRQDASELMLKEKGITNIHSYNSWAKGLKHLLLGKVELWTHSDFDLPIVAERAHVELDRLEPVYTLYTSVLYIGFSKSTSTAIVKKWQSTLDTIKADGTFEQIVKKWAEYYKANWVVKDGMVQIKYE